MLVTVRRMSADLFQYRFRRTVASHSPSVAPLNKFRGTRDKVSRIIFAEVGANFLGTRGKQAWNTLAAAVNGENVSTPVPFNNGTVSLAYDTGETARKTDLTVYFAAELQPRVPFDRTLKRREAGGPTSTFEFLRQAQRNHRRNPALYYLSDHT